MDFQTVVMRLQEYWADQGCLLWQPYNVQVGAGTMNPATVLRVLGPEPWNVAYVEPSVRPADGRYGENPNRWQQFYQYQVILKPDPGNPQELYLDSLRAIGIDTAKHDVRFVEDNWESPALGAWGLGWEVWLDGQEITQYTYFQQAGGVDLEPVSVEITYGLERIVMVLQGVRGFPDMRWQGQVTYGDVHLQGEIEHCTYNFEVASVDNLHQMYDLCEAEAWNALKSGLVMPAHDYVLKCSHLFNVLDARGAVGVTERARYFARMRELARDVTALYVQQREDLGYPLLGKVTVAPVARPELPETTQPQGQGPHDFMLEIGTEELPVADLDSALQQLADRLPSALHKARLSYDELSIMGTPRRIVAYVRGLSARQADEERTVKGPPARIAYDEDDQPTRAAQGFARSQGIELAGLQVRTLEGKEYVVAVIRETGREAAVVLGEMLPDLMASLSFARSMRWNESGVSFSRPLRWFVALLDNVVVPLAYAGLQSGRTSRGNRALGSPEITIARAADYERMMVEADVVLDVAERERRILDGAQALAKEVAGRVPEDADLLREVANLVEYPLPIRGAFEKEYLRLPQEVLLAVMRKHQRYFPVFRDGQMLPYFVTVANGSGVDVDAVRHGNEKVLRARYADVAFFYDADKQRPLEAYTSQLSTLTFQEQLGSVLDKVERLKGLVLELSEMMGLSQSEAEAAARAAALCKSDLATQLVIELTSLQGTMGRHYAALAGESDQVALAIEEHYLPRFMGDRLPSIPSGVVLALADRLDTLVGLFAVGIRPTGAADPWGLRRAALGVVQLLIGKEISLALPEALSLAADRLPVEADEDCLREVMEYIVRRLEGLFLDDGFAYDTVQAVLNERSYDPYLAFRTVQDFGPWVERGDWEDLLDSYARCVRITRDYDQVFAVDRARFTEPVALALHEAYCQASAQVSANNTIDGFLGALEDLRPHITKFFDDVLVMDKDIALRQNRLGLLQAISRLPDGIADLSVMEGF